MSNYQNTEEAEALTLERMSADSSVNDFVVGRKLIIGAVVSCVIVIASFATSMKTNLSVSTPMQFTTDAFWEKIFLETAPTAGNAFLTR